MLGALQGKCLVEGIRQNLLKEASVWSETFSSYAFVSVQYNYKRRSVGHHLHV